MPHFERSSSVFVLFRFRIGVYRFIFFLFRQLSVELLRESQNTEPGRAKAIAAAVVPAQILSFFFV